MTTRYVDAASREICEECPAHDECSHHEGGDSTGCVAMTRMARAAILALPVDDEAVEVFNRAREKRFVEGCASSADCYEAGITAMHKHMAGEGE